MMRVEILESILRFISAAQTEIRFSALPVEQIIQKHGTDLKFLRICGEECQKGSNFSHAWLTGISEGTKDHGLKDKDIALLRSFGSGFGASDTEGQLSHFSLYYELITDGLKNAREEKARKSKLYLMLGVFSGMAAALLLC